MVLCNEEDTPGVPCGKSFKDNWFLSRHVAACHTPVPCKRCPELGDFPNRTALKEHEQSHRSQFKCPRAWCPFNTNRRTTFNDHIRDCRVSNQRIICGQADCDRSVAAFGNYHAHLRRDHNMTLEEVNVAIAAERPEDDPLEAAIEDGMEHAEPMVIEPVLEQEPLRFPQGPGYDLTPLLTNDERQLISHGRLQILYSKTGRGPLLAYLRSTPDTIAVRFEGRGSRKNLGPETNVELHHQATHGDYANSIIRYDKGHVMMAENLAGDEETAHGRHVYSVTLPQLAEFNRIVWRELESYERLFITTHVDTDSFAGGFYVGQVEMCGRLRVASHFFKILVGSLPNGQKDVELFVLKHQVYPAGIPPKTFHRTWEELRQLDLEGVIPQLDLDNVRRFNIHDYNEEFGGL